MPNPKNTDELIDDGFPAPKSRRAAAPSAKPGRPPAASGQSGGSRRAPPIKDDFVDDDPLAEPEIDQIPYTNDDVRRVEQLMVGRGKKHFDFATDYPAELPKAFRVYWDELVVSFPADHFTRGDIVTMKLYCRCAHDIDRCNKMIESEGDVIHGSKGPMINPRVKVRQISEGTLMNILTKFRNQPASRANSENFQGRQDKKQQDDRASHAVESDEDELLAGSQRSRAESRGDTYMN